MKWLKAFFKKADIEEYNIPVEKLFDWFMEQSAEQQEEEKQRIAQKLGQLRGLRTAVKNKLVLLAEAELMNKALPEKEKQIMLGNREAYIRTLTAFIDQLAVPEEITHERIQAFCTRFTEQLQQFTRMSARNYVLLKEFFAHEVSDITKQLKSAEQEVSGLRETTLAAVASIKKKINGIEMSIEQKGSRSQSIRKEKQGLTLLQGMITAAEEQMHQLRNSKSYQELEALHKQMAALKGKMKNHHDVLAKSFSKLERPIRKYCHRYPEESRLFEAYLNNMADALSSDANLLIIGVLARLRSTILTGQLALDEREKQEAVAKLNELSVEHLKNVAALISKTSEQITDVHKRIRLNSVQREIEELEYRIGHLRAKHAAAGARIKKGEKKENSTELEALRETLEEEIESYLEAPVNIILPDEEKEEEHGSEEEQQHEQEIEQAT